MTVPLHEYLGVNVLVAVGLAADAMMATIIRIPRSRAPASAWRWAGAIGLTHWLFPMVGFVGTWYFASGGWAATVHGLGFVLMALFTVHLVRLGVRTVDGLEHGGGTTSTWLAVWAVSVDALASGPGMTAATAHWTQGQIWLSFPLIGAIVFGLVLAAGGVAPSLHRRYLLSVGTHSGGRQPGDARRLFLGLVGSFYLEVMLFSWFAARSAVEAVRPAGIHTHEAVPWIAGAVVTAAVFLCWGRRIHRVRREAAHAAGAWARAGAATEPVTAPSTILRAEVLVPPPTSPCARMRPAGRPLATPLLGHAVLLSSAAFVVHLAWELVQCPIFFVHGTYDPTWRGMIIAALGDVGITWLIYVGVAAASRCWRWDHRPWRATQWLTLVAAALAIGAFVEWRGVGIGRWRYTDAMPVIPGLGIGLVPIVQMLLLTPLLVLLTRRALDREPSRSR